MTNNAAFLPYGHQLIDESDIQAVTSVMRSDWLTQGPKVQEFEAQLADFFDARFAVTFSSGTAALHAAYFAAGVHQGDVVLTTPITFAASANAALFLGADVRFVDVEPDTVNIDASLLEEKITKRTKAVLPVDFAGQPVDLDEVREIATRHNLTVIEDACHAIGSTYKGKKIGSISDLTTFSFHPVKNMTTGEGGAVLTNSPRFATRLALFRNHGIEKETKRADQNDLPWYYKMKFLGNNYRLTDMQCALGISQLKKLNSFISRRRAIVAHYNEAFSATSGLETPCERTDRRSAWHLYVIKLNLEHINKSREDVFKELRTKGIGVQVHYIPVYWHPYYQNKGFKKGTCPVAERYYESAITLPLFPAMTDDDTERVITTVEKCLEM